MSPVQGAENEKTDLLTAIDIYIALNVFQTLF